MYFLRVLYWFTSSMSHNPRAFSNWTNMYMNQQWPRGMGLVQRATLVLLLFYVRIVWT